MAVRPCPGGTCREFVALAAALLLAAGAGGCRKPEAPPPRPPPLVTVAPAIARDVPVYLDEIGSCTAREVVSILPQASGRIIERHFVDGADVKKGERLFTIDPRPYQAALDQAREAAAKAGVTDLMQPQANSAAIATPPTPGKKSSSRWTRSDSAARERQTTWAARGRG